MAAKVLGEQALAITNHNLTQADAVSPSPASDLTAQSRARQVLNQAPEHKAQVLLYLARTYEHLEMFDKARSAEQESLNLYRSIFGGDSTAIAGCHSKLASICNEQINAIRNRLVQGLSSYPPGTRVRVGGLQNQPHYNGLAGIALTHVVDSRVRVRLDQGNKQLRLKMQNVRPVVAILAVHGREALYTQLLDLMDETIANHKEFFRITLKVNGAKHLSTSLAHYNLGMYLLQTRKPSDTREAVAMLTKAHWILRRVATNEDPRLLEFLQ